MNLAELKQQIIDKEFNNVYIFTGDEIKVMNIYIDQIAKTQERKVVRKETVGEIFKTLKVSKLTSESNVYVILDDFDFLKQEKHWEQTFTSTNDHTIILVYSKLDKRGKFYKDFKERICEFEKLHETVLANYILKEIDIDKQDATNLAIMCENSYNRILMETDKIFHLAYARNISMRDAYKLAIQEDLIHTENSELTFKIADAVCKRNIDLVFKLLNDFDATQESPIAILSLIYANIKAMLLVAVCPPGSKVSDVTGLTGFQIKLAHEKGNNYTPSELLNIMKEIKFIDESIKIGRVDPQYALQYLAVSTM